jgi:hypothetical protein
MVTTVVLEEPHRSDLTSQQMAGLVEQDQVQQGQEHQGRTGAHPIISVDITVPTVVLALHQQKTRQNPQERKLLVQEALGAQALAYMMQTSNCRTHQVA